MLKTIFVFCVIGIIAAFIFRDSFNTFFAQDDFLLINHFSQNSILVDFANAFGPPEINHWRPIHNFYFLVSGNLFGKNYFAYHLLTYLFHIGTAFFVYKIIFELSKSKFQSFLGALMYTISPAHFVSLFWISGGATLLGFFFLSASVYSFQKKSLILSYCLFLLSILTSESMVLGVMIFFILLLLKKRGPIRMNFTLPYTIISATFLFIKFIVLGYYYLPGDYKLIFSLHVLTSIKYYILRIFGFVDVSGNKIISSILVGWYAVIFCLFLSKIRFFKEKVLIIGLLVTFLGLFPFILIPYHLSAHYMNLSIFGFSLAISSILIKYHRFVGASLILIFVVISFFSVNKIKENNWVIKRSRIAQNYIIKIEKENHHYGGTLIFMDNDLASSSEAYFSLGTGKAINFWFPERNFKTCFVAIENCSKIN